MTHHKTCCDHGACLATVSPQQLCRLPYIIFEKNASRGYKVAEVFSKKMQMQLQNAKKKPSWLLQPKNTFSGAKLAPEQFLKPKGYFQQLLKVLEQKFTWGWICSSLKQAHL